MAPYTEFDGLGLTLGHGLLAILLGLGHPLMASASPSARRMRCCLSPSARRITAAAPPSARVIAAWRSPSAEVTTAPARPLCLHLLVHGVHDVRRRVDALDLHPATRTPHLSVASSRISRSSRLILVPGGERLVELHVTDDVAQVGLRQLGDRHHEVGHVVDELLGLGWLVVDDGVHGHDHVLSDVMHLLGRHVDHLLAHVHRAQGLDERHDQAQAGLDRLLVPAQCSIRPFW
jgi:hypothetical protein